LNEYVSAEALLRKTDRWHCRLLRARRERPRRGAAEQRY
jgi:hypothetical protein